MFNPSEATARPSSRTQEVKNLDPLHEIVGHVTKGSSHMIARIIPAPHPPPPDAKPCDNHVANNPNKSCDGHVTENRNSTESNDTGYTSGASPALNDGQLTHVEIGEFQLEFKETNSTSNRDADKVRWVQALCLVDNLY